MQTMQIAHNSLLKNIPLFTYLFKLIRDIIHVSRLGNNISFYIQQSLFETKHCNINA